MWSIDEDPLLDTLRSNPRYEIMRLELEERMESLRENIERARETDDWQSLRDRSRSI